MKKAFNLKKALVLVLVLVMCISVFVACDNTTTDGTQYDTTNIDQAINYLKAIYKANLGDVTSADYDLVDTVVGNGQTFQVEWSIEITEGNENSAVISTRTDTEGETTVEVKYVKIVTDVNSTSSYTLTAIVKDEDGEHTATLTLNKTVPKTEKVTVAEFLKKETGDTLYAIEGFVVAAGGSATNAGSFVLADSTGAVFSYNKQIVEVGEKYLVVGTRSVNNNVPQLGTTGVTKLEKAEGETLSIEPIEWAAADIDLADASTKVTDYTGKYYKFTGQTLYKNTSGYWNAGTLKEGKTNEYDQLLNLYAPSGMLLDAMVGEQASVYGYVRGLSSSYITVQVVKVELTSDSSTLTDAEKVESAKNALSLNAKYTNDFTLPTSLRANVTWAVTGTGATIGEDGVSVTIARTTAAQTVTFTATIKSGDVTDTKEFKVTIPAQIVDIMADVQEDTAYVLVIDQTNLDKKLYIQNATANTYYIASTDDASKADSVYVKKVDGGYKLYFKVDSEEKYISIEKSSDGAHTNILRDKAQADAATFVWDAENCWFKTTLSDGDYFIGTSGNYTTVSANSTERDGFPAYLAVKSASSEPVEPVVKPELINKIEGATMTSYADLEALVPESNNTTQDKYYAIGYVKSIDNATYGNIYIEDAEGNELLVYGIYGFDGKVRFDSLPVKPAVGDIVVVYGVMTNYNGTKEMKNAWLMQHGTEVCTTSDAYKMVQIKVSSPVEADFTLSDLATWTVKSGTAITIDGTSAKVTRGEADQTVVLTATIGDVSKDFTVVVTKLPSASDPVLAATLTSDVSNRTSYSSAEQVWSANGITLTNTGSNIGNYAAPIRLYKNTNTTISYSSMAKIVFTVNKADYVSPLQESLSGKGTVTVSGKVVTIVFSEPISSLEFTMSAQVRLDSVEVYTLPTEA